LPAEGPDHLFAGPKVEMVGVAEDDLGAGPLDLGGVEAPDGA